MLTAQAAFSSAPVVTQGADWVSPPSVPTVKTVDMRSLPPAPGWKPGDPIKSIPRLSYGPPADPNPVPVNPVFGHDPLVDLQQRFVGRQTRALSAPIINQNVLNSTAQPNDPTGDIGPLQFVAAINGTGGGQFAVYNKTTGAQVVAPTLMENLSTTAGICRTGLGDPIVLFDELANRWVLTEFTQGANGLCVYLSDVADLSGTVTWTRYEFTLPSFPDYPKYGMWPSAYFVGANEGGTAGARPFYAMNRQAMLAGTPATLQRLTIPNLAGFSFQMTQPADLAGSTAPPANAPGIFMRHRDDEAHNAGSNNPNADFLELYEFNVNWTTPANSTITGPTTFSMPEFSSNLNGLTAFQAFPQPSGQRLDPLRETVMHRLTYRRTPSYEVLVGNLVTDLFLGAGSQFPDDTGAVRWFELRRVPGEVPELFANGFEDGAAPGAWALHQTGTYAPADGAAPADQGDRWMAASSIDQDGNIALAYNMVRQGGTPAIPAGLRYTGRLAGDPLGVMTATETTIVDGTGSVSGERWGDYNDMGIDPADGCTFWFIGNYSSGGARTNRAASFKFDECGGPSFTMTSPAPAVSLCANTTAPTNAAPITLNLASINGFSTAATLSYPNAFATGIFGTLTPTSIPTYPGSSVAQLTATNAAAPGTTQIVARAVAGAVTRDVQLSLTLATQTPPAPTLSAPANAATGVGATPTFSWAASAQANEYLVEVATNSGFSPLLFSQTVTGTSLVSPQALPTGTQIFWRVRANNICGNNTSPVFSFTTASAPGDCGASSTTVYGLEGFETGAPGWAQGAGGSGTNTWAVSPAFPFAGTNSARGTTPTTASDQRYVSPSISLPTVGNGLFLIFQSRHAIEPNTATSCYDGALLEVSTDGGTNFTQVPNAQLLTDPYTGPIATNFSNPAAGLQAWCGTQAFTRNVVDLAPYANQANVRFRFRLTSDSSQALTEGWIIDDVEVKRCN
jgi:hypothetical protein